MQGVFITGTDTDCGKTEIALAVMEGLAQRGLKVLGMKPVASGCERTANGLRNPDACRLQVQGSCPVSYELVNPYAFEPPIAPHIAASLVGVSIDLEVICNSAQRLAAECDFLVVEGVGGWRVPLASSLFVSDLPVALDLPVILVTGLKLGCINHSLLTAESIDGSGARTSGWVANQIDPGMHCRDDNLTTLANLINFPYLGTVPWLPAADARQVARHLDLTSLLKSLRGRA